MPDDDSYLIDDRRSACLCDHGSRYTAATAVAADGSEHLVLAQHDAIGNTDVRYDADCIDVDHEQPGELPLDYVRRIAIAGRKRKRTTE
jgi:hypothetical protein